MQNPIEQDSDHKSELATAATSTAAAVTILATSNYAVDGNSIQRTSKVGPVSHNSSMGIEGSKLTTTDERGFNISGAIDSNQHHEKKVGIFYNEEHHQQDLNLGGFLKSGEENHKKQTLTRDSESTEKYTKIGSIFRSEEATYKESGPDGTIQGREAETRCCGLKVSSSEESYCCTSSGLCGYKCSTNCCGEGVSLNCSTVCCFRPICNAIDNINCPSLPSIPSCNLPNLSNLGTCIEPVGNCIASTINHIDCERVVGCLESAGPIISEICEIISSIAPRD